MRRRWFGVPLAVLIGVSSCWSGRATADDGAEEGEPSVPLKRLVLFNSGVGYFEHTGAVRDTATVDLQFRVEDVNDLLKSMVVQDLGNGRVTTVTYGTRDPITKTLKTFAIDLTENPTLADLLQQVRGERVQLAAPNEITGTILGVETRKREVDDEVLEIEVLNLLTESGLRSVPLEQVTSIKLLNERLDQELRKALQVLAAGNDTDKKTVGITFQGEGERDVRIGYVQETPIWKTSYRLVLDEEGSPYLQGWAIVENTSETDWNDVGLVLVSGRPISFEMDLYQPLYVDRPVVVPELYSSLAPQLYEQDLTERAEEFREMAKKAKSRDEALANRMREQRARLAGRGAAPGAPAADRKADDSMDMVASVRSAATAADVGELFQYEIQTPVTLERQRSAMLPIVNAEVEGEKLSIYNASVHGKHPLNGLRFTNTTDLHLMRGPVTVFDGGTYAGDARLPDLPPKSSRLVSYAMDLEVEVATASKSKPRQLVSVKLDKGVLYAKRKLFRSTTYTVKNSDFAVKTVLVERPVDANWTLVKPEEPAEKTRDVYRFAVEAQPGEPTELTVDEEQMQQETVYLTNASDQQIRIYLSSSEVSQEVKDALQEIVERKHELADLAAERKRLEQQVQTIAKDQDRIQQNMARLERNTELYTKYVKKLSDQEDEIETLRAKIADLQQQEAKKQKELDEYLSKLDVG